MRVSLYSSPQICKTRIFQHCHHGMNHQSLGNKIIEPDFGSNRDGEIKCRQKLGVLLRYYYRDAA
jgi:hypothetical protein